MTNTFEFGGCSRKLPEGALRDIIIASSLRGASTTDCAVFQHHLQDIGFTIDSIFPLSGNAYDFARMAVVHAISDLNAKGFHASHISVSFSFPKSLGRLDMAEMLDGVADQCASGGILFGKGHTVAGDELSLTVAAVGPRRVPLGSVAKYGSLVVVMTKPLGASRLYRLSCLDENTTSREDALKQLTRDHQGILGDLGGDLLGGVDVSGFGLASALEALSSETRTHIDCELKIVSRCDTKYASVPTQCEYALNAAEAQSFRLGRLTDRDTLSLFGTEVCGPILWLFPEEQIDRVMSNLRVGGHKPQIVGSARRESPEVPQVTYKGLQ